MFLRAGVTCLALLVCASAHAQGISRPVADAEGRKGWEAIRQGRHQDAADAFAAAVAAEPRDPSLHLGAGLAASLLGEVAEARRSLERALELSPSFSAASLLLGDLLYRDNDLGGAIRVYEAARAHAADNAAISSRLEQARREFDLQSNFFQAQGAHFTVLFEGPADEALARRAIDVLEAAYWEVGTALLTFPDRAIPVVLYTEEQFRDITRSPGWAAAAYDGRIRVPMRGALSNPEELERVLTHEFTHALVRSVVPKGVPTWLNEGLAVLFEARGRDWTDAQLRGSSYRLPLNRLAGGFEGLSGAEARMAYAQSAAAVRSLMDQAGSIMFMTLLRDIGKGEPFESAFERRMLTSFSEFAASLDASH